LFKNLGLNLSLSLSNKGLKFECSTVFRLENVLSLESIVIDEANTKVGVDIMEKSIYKVDTSLTSLGSVILEFC
jgi:hypothetical protein